ncbi:hypothetical protein DM860_002057 [Cuscuta australis]|uniref:RNase H type-1 domain-containing protein n=1 Tax=Cuscuta australis TaxID=267555 RepID=A0A328DWV0_9ASTE|nr:hypothetical protein DM860_002057 [Cuscuta australis]
MSSDPTGQTDINVRLAGISLEEEEEPVPVFLPEQDQVQQIPAMPEVWTLVGRFLTDRPIKDVECRRIIEDCWYSHGQCGLLRLLYTCGARLQAWGGPQVAATIIYSIWTARNKAVWEGWVPSVAGCWKTAKCMVEAWCQTWNNPMQQRRRRQPPQRRHDAFTCYIDGGFKSDTKEATFGFVLYEPGGNFVKAINGKLNFCLNPLMAEALALKEALTWIKDKSVPRVQPLRLLVNNPVRLGTLLHLIVSQTL